MPLVLMCGIPSCGKTIRALELKKHISENTPFSVYIINDDIGSDKNVVYADSRLEKDLRSHLRTATQRKISKEDLVIVDSLNYIKGFRYELFCVSKACSTPQCVIHCEAAPDIAKQWNHSRDSKDAYSTEIFDALVMRFEAPDSKNRWDSPLFTILGDDKLPGEAIFEALYHRKAPPPNLSTQSQPLSSTNFLYELDRITQDIVACLMQEQKTSIPGDEVSIAGAKDKIILSRKINMAELSRLRRQFISVTKMHPMQDTRNITNTFVQYLNNNCTNIYQTNHGLKPHVHVDSSPHIL